MLTTVHQRPQPSATWANTPTVNADEQPRAGVNEPRTEPTGRWTGVAGVARFRGLRNPIHHWPGPFLAWASTRSAFVYERLATGVNETETETGPPGLPSSRMPGGAR